ncbi:MAG: hypothetical protein Q9191_002871 [Dirinaria sp. TL-2023a]
MESRKRLLQYFSGQQPSRPNPKIDYKPIRDPTLQRFAYNQLQAVTAEHSPGKGGSESPQRCHQPSQCEEPPVIIVERDHSTIIEEHHDHHKRARPPRRRAAEHHQYESESEAPPPKQRVRSRPPPKATRQRARRDWDRVETASWETRSAATSRWASAITPLPQLT